MHTSIGWSITLSYHFTVLFIFRYTHSGAENGVRGKRWCRSKRKERAGEWGWDGDRELNQRSSIRGVASPAPSVELGIDRTAGLLLVLCRGVPGFGVEAPLCFLLAHISAALAQSVLLVVGRGCVLCGVRLGVAPGQIVDLGVG